MKEIVTRGQIDLLFGVLAIVGPLLGASISWFRSRRWLVGFAWGLLFTANWLLWRLYNAITDRLGLDTVRNLMVNLLLFISIGAIAGYLLARLTKRGDMPDATGRNGG